MFLSLILVLLAAVTCETQSLGASDGCNWCPGWSKADLSAAQLADPDVGTMIGWQQAFLDRPARRDTALVGASRQLRRLWSQWSRLRLVDGVLYREFTPADGSKSFLQLVVPDSLRSVILRQAHDDVPGGHFGVDRTLARVRCRFYWPFMSTAVSLYCKACVLCASRKAPVPHHQAPMVLDWPSFPLQCVGLDLLGPLPTTDKGNKHTTLLLFAITLLSGLKPSLFLTYLLLQLPLHLLMSLFVVMVPVVVRVVRFACALAGCVAHACILTFRFHCTIALHS